MRFRQVLPGEGFTQARIKPPFNHQLVCFRRLFQRCEVTALDAFLAHPHIASVEGEIVSGRTSAEDDHSATLGHHAGNRERRLAWMFEHHVDVITFASNVPDGTTEAAAAFHIGVEAVRIIHIGQGTPAIEVTAVDDPDSTHVGYVVGFFIAGDYSDWLGADCPCQLESK